MIHYLKSTAIGAVILAVFIAVVIFIFLLPGFFIVPLFGPPMEVLQEQTAINQLAQRSFASLLFYLFSGTACMLLYISFRLGKAFS